MTLERWPDGAEGVIYGYVEGRISRFLTQMRSIMAQMEKRPAWNRVRNDRKQGEVLFCAVGNSDHNYINSL
jgi:hypothetical protein